MNRSATTTFVASAFAMASLAGCGEDKPPVKRAADETVAAAVAATPGLAKEKLKLSEPVEFGEPHINYWKNGGFSVSGRIQVKPGKTDNGEYTYRLNVNPDGKQRLTVDGPTEQWHCSKTDDGTEVCAMGGDDPLPVLVY